MGDRHERIVSTWQPQHKNRRQRGSPFFPSLTPPSLHLPLAQHIQGANQR